MAGVLGAGFGAGLTALLYPGASGIDAMPSVNVSALPTAAPDRYENTQLYKLALTAASAVYRADFASLSELTHPERGCLFAPFSTVDKTKNQTLMPGQIKAISGSSEEYIWGVSDQTDQPISLTGEGFFREYLQIRDFSAAPAAGFGTVLRTGNAIENVLAEYPEEYMVDLYFPGERTEGAVRTDWASLKFVFGEYGDALKLVAIVRSVYTEQ
ncbi:MAG: hypothetical protein LBR85_03015 [Oscillospiraceae bacterium]|nr:hypothetical protein [Oscillospiraceae bacterium]